MLPTAAPPRHFIRIPALTLISLLSAAPTPAAAQEKEQADITIGWATSDIARTSIWWTAAGKATNRAADLGLDAAFGSTSTRRTRDIFGRLGRLWLVNLPIAALTEGAAHDSGHFARLGESGIHSGRRQIQQWPWPVPIAISVEFIGLQEETELPLSEGLAVLGGGEQAAHVTKQQIADEIFSRHDADYFQWILLTYASFDEPIYAWTDLQGSIGGQPGDFRQYAAVLTFLAPDPSLEIEERHSTRLQRDAWWNLADYALWQGVARLVHYVATGERRTVTSTLRIGGLRFVPSGYATLGSNGPERGVNVRVLSSSFLTRVNVRQTTTPADRSRWGTGIDVRSRAPERLLPEFAVDVWQEPDAGGGARVEAGGRRAVRLLGHPLEIAVRAGYKTSGYLADAPARAGLLIGFTATSPF